MEGSFPQRGIEFFYDHEGTKTQKAFDHSAFINRHAFVIDVLLFKNLFVPSWLIIILKWKR
tara:strand:- start:623 stop:805 length:183 start_codon:yes stop_codon:yes gene_type:complete